MTMRASADKRRSTLRRTGLAGIALGGLALIACEVPLILALVGLGGLGSGTELAPSPYLEIVGAVLVVTGGGLLIAFRLRRARWKQEGAGP